ncbi:MAG: MogA/MoaB family molybdenum cofactor biosynthesis protein [Eubacteriales bacterium]|nr:MogA/MoaB family molybdenum cofactor biosynthesis protein [Eubacteriales bacterium]MDD3350133.1 MogA/MoaB family molybdenum cofactor biosynthesis protein [Eubacteriales bacterium]
MNTKKWTAGVITSSDKGYAGAREDKSGQVIMDLLETSGYEIIKYVIVPDEQDMLEKEMKMIADELKADLIITTGGTGFSTRDVTPEATKAVIEKETPGISEAIRYFSLSITKKAMLSRGTSGIRGKSLIVNLPGSPKAVKESLEYLIEPLEHGLEILTGKASECATT